MVLKNKTTNKQVGELEVDDAVPETLVDGSGVYTETPLLLNTG